MIGHGLTLFISDRDLRWAGRTYEPGTAKDAMDAELRFIVKAALRLFKVVPESHPAYLEDGVLDDVKVEVERDAALRGFQIQVMAPFLTFGVAKPLPIVPEVKLNAVEMDGPRFLITGEIVPTPKKETTVPRVRAREE